MQYRPPNVNQEFSNTNRFGSISDSFSRLSASSECMASVKKLGISLGIMMYLNWISTALAENTLTTMDFAKRAVIPPHLDLRSVGDIVLNPSLPKSIHYLRHHTHM